MPDLLGSENTLIASMFWGAVGMGFFVYGKKQRAMTALFGGILVMGFTYFIESALYMSLASIAVIIAIFVLKDRF
ncbi:MAG: Amino acid transport protein [Verrucomicrobiales bacterium]|nr:Amino acid transport protein [Verrucomicrobiales bacterium]